MGLFDSNIRGGPVKKTGRQLTEKGKDKRFLNWQRKSRVMGYDYPTASGAIDYSPIDPIMMATGVGAAVRGGQALLPAVADELTMGGRGLYKSARSIGKKIFSKPVDKFYQSSGISKGPSVKSESNLLDELKLRAKTPEGKKRLKAQGISPKKIEDISIEIRSTSGSFSRTNPVTKRPEITLGTSGPSYLQSGTIRHEVEHFIQKGKTADIDNLLGSLSLKTIKNPPKRALGETIWDYQARIGVKPKIYSSDAEQHLYNTGESLDYFKYGARSSEKSPMLAELQQYMVDRKLIKNVYDEITPGKVKTVMQQWEKKKDYPLRILDIIKPTDENFNILSKGLNKMFQVGAPVGLAGGLYNTNTK